MLMREDTENNIITRKVFPAHIHTIYLSRTADRGVWSGAEDNAQ